MVVSASAGCDGSPVLEARAVESVTLVLSVDARLFAHDGTLLVRLWDSDQLAALQRNARCSVAYDSETRAQEIRCPPGIEYRPVTPEEFRFAVRDAGASLEIRSARLRVGQTFRILVSGPSRDGCNTTSAELTRSAASERVVLERLVWETTAKACGLEAPSP